eukprot:1178895-Prorocentrum_minimum.AAC.3
MVGLQGLARTVPPCPPRLGLGLGLGLGLSEDCTTLPATPIGSGSGSRSGLGSGLSQDCTTHVDAIRRAVNVIHHSGRRSARFCSPEVGLAHFGVLRGSFGPPLRPPLDPLHPPWEGPHADVSGAAAQGQQGRHHPRVHQILRRRGGLGR